MNIKAPLKQTIGAGDIVHRAASAVGIEQKTGCKCGKAQAWLNSKFSFGPDQPDSWSQAIPPLIPKGWAKVSRCKTANKETALYTNGRDWMIWDIYDGIEQYKWQRSYPGGLEAMARENWTQACLRR